MQSQCHLVMLLLIVVPVWCCCTVRVRQLCCCSSPLSLSLSCVVGVPESLLLECSPAKWLFSGAMTCQLSGVADWVVCFPISSQLSERSFPRSSVGLREVLSCLEILKLRLVVDTMN